MCGIAGVVRSDGRPPDREVVERMCAAQAHRGPDSRGVHVDGGAALGVQRLRVIDLETGDQPLFSEDGAIAVVLNGEIYNHRELRAELEQRGHRFASRADTEVIAHLYEEVGAACVERLHGMFAFAVWDAPRRRLFCARDRVGKKPFLYAERAGAISFASELRALIEDPEVSRDLDHGALDAFLTYQYVPSPRSVFRSVTKLPPGCTLTYEDGRVTVERYWRLRRDRRAGDGDPAGELREHLRAAVRRRLVADVPLGAFLSGGIDSSTVVGLMAEESSEPVRTFSIGFDEPAFDELPNARRVAERFGTDHHELVVRPDALELIPRIVRHYGEPFADTSALPSFVVSELTRREVTVALNGDGGDEAFAGYDRYALGLRLGRIASFVPSPLARAAGGAGDPPVNGKRLADRARRAARVLALPARERFRFTVATFEPCDRARLYTHAFAEQVAAAPPCDPLADAWDETAGDDELDVMLEADLRTYLPDDLLVKMDIASMAHSLEARSPFLDHEVVEFAASLPPSLKLRGGETKALLRDTVRGWLPDEVLDAPKRGFGLPMVGGWFRGQLREHVTEVLTDTRARGRGYFVPGEVEDLLARHLSGHEDHGPQLWTLMMFELWHRELLG